MQSDEPKRRFLLKVEITNTCWLWTGGRDSHGYGKLTLDKKQIGAHKVAYQLWKGEIPEGLCVLHTCDVNNCVNPEHLWLGTKADNSQDMVRKGRMYHPYNKGIAHGSSKLTEEEILEIRDLYPLGQYSHRKLAKKFNVSYNHIKRILDRDVWRHI